MIFLCDIACSNRFFSIILKIENMFHFDCSLGFKMAPLIKICLVLNIVVQCSVIGERYKRDDSDSTTTNPKESAEDDGDESSAGNGFLHKIADFFKKIPGEFSKFISQLSEPLNKIMKIFQNA